MSVNDDISPVRKPKETKKKKSDARLRTDLATHKPLITYCIFFLRTHKIKFIALANFFFSLSFAPFGTSYVVVIVDSIGNLHKIIDDATNRWGVDGYTFFFDRRSARTSCR